MNKPFAIIAIDQPGSEAARAEYREGHLAHFKAHADRILVAGPLSGASSGSLVIYNAESEEEALAFMQGDPFHESGVWATIQVYAFKAGAGQWVNG